MGRNGSGKSSLLWALQGSRRRGGRARSRVDGADPADARRRPAPRRSSGWCRRPPPTCSTSRPSPRSAPRPTAARGSAARSSTGSCPASPTTPHPRDLSEGQRLALALVAGARRRRRRCCCSTSRPAASTTPPSAARRDPAPARRRRATRCWWPPTTWSSPPRPPTRSSCSPRARSSPPGPYAAVVAESPAFAPQVTKVLGPPLAARRRGRRAAVSTATTVERAYPLGAAGPRVVLGVASRRPG